MYHVGKKKTKTKKNKTKNYLMQELFGYLPQSIFYLWWVDCKNHDLYLVSYFKHYIFKYTYLKSFK